MSTSKDLVLLIVLLFESILLARATNKSIGDITERRNTTATTGNATSSSNRASGGGIFLIESENRISDASNLLQHKMGDTLAMAESVSRNNDHHSLGDPGAFETDLSTAEGMEHMHIMKKKPKYKKVKMEVLEPKIKYKKIKMKYKKPVKKMKKKKVKGWIKAEKSKMKKMKHYEHHA